MENQEYHTGKNQSVVSIGNWVVTLILISIPIVNLIALLYWAFAGGTPVSKSNFAKASLIMTVVWFILVLLLWKTIPMPMNPYGPYYSS